MIVTNSFTFIHMHKTGGQTLTKAITSSIPDHELIGYHYPYSQLPAHATNKPIIGVVRNPWDWYLSWYAFNTSPHMRSPLFVVLSDGGNGDFSSTTTNLINLGSDRQESINYRNALKSILPETLDGNKGVGLTKSCIDDLAESGKGYYSWLFERMHGKLDDKLLHIGRFENLIDDFISIMSDLKIDETEEMRTQLKHIGRSNSSKHSHYSNYYTSDLKQLVAEKDKELIERYNYGYLESTDASKAVIPLTKNPSLSFGKLLGKKLNYLTLVSQLDVSVIKDKLLQVPEIEWGKSGREKLFKVHRDTQALLLIHDEDYRHYNPTYQPMFDFFKNELEPFLQQVSSYYGNEGFFVRALFAKLRAGGTISAHIDGRYSLLNCHRIHLPIITNDKNLFNVGGEPINMRVGDLIEINNTTVHYVENNSDEDRIHLIIDWVPNETVRDEDREQANPVSVQSKVELSYDGQHVSRNAPCPCGSGKRFRQCHGQLS